MWLQRFRDKNGNHVCWVGHKTKTYRLAFEVRATAVDQIDPLKRVHCFFLDASSHVVHPVLQEYSVQLKHDNLCKLVKVLHQSAGLKVDQFMAMLNNKEDFDKFVAAMTGKDFPTSVYIWHDPKDPSRITLTLRPL